MRLCTFVPSAFRVRVTVILGLGLGLGSVSELGLGIEKRLGEVRERMSEGRGNVTRLVPR
jgi:hypothetical protein